MKKVLIIQRLLPHYRIDFFNILREKLHDKNIELTLIYGKDEASLKKDEVDLKWGIYIPTKIIRLSKAELYWQACMQYIEDKDLVIVEQANKNLLNYILIIRKVFLKKKFAYWGHGLNRQADENDARNKFKKLFINQCSWWFAYTAGVKNHLINNSFPADRITCVQNAIDTRSLAAQYASLTQFEADQLKEDLGIISDCIGIFCGGIYKEKRMDFLLQACDLIRQKISSFHLIVVGSGTDAHIVKEAAKTRNWIHYVGPKFGIAKVKYFKISSVFLMPGLVGLAVLDSFAMQTPTITTQYPFHSPEIEYLAHGINGLITENTVDSYAAAVIEVFQQEALHEKLKEGCKKALIKYTVEQMAENFADGIEKSFLYPV